MSQRVDATLELEQYQCRSCGRLFWVRAADRSALDLDFGCPYGCDDNGRHVCSLNVRVEKVAAIPLAVEEPRVRA